LTSGLQNLGNTCYMNSALQVIANLKFIHEYFIQHRINTKQTNIRNPLGFQGSLVNAFSSLMDRMWQFEGTVAPRNFKYVLAKCCEQFVGFDQ
jgi:ubiquitin carboxyl-terminal hydrolase 4/11/15